MNKSTDEKEPNSDPELAVREEAVLRRMLATPPENHKPLGREKTGKRPKKERD